mmetsp:Transcript_1408/g.1901  ORF Transcript_1408/g.1901 Transcript_1408/m.1901 type:complete len:205 (-) Transcript_1408:38-652(-)
MTKFLYIFLIWYLLFECTQSWAPGHQCSCNRPEYRKSQTYVFKYHGTNPCGNKGDCVDWEGDCACIGAHECLLPGKDCSNGNGQCCSPYECRPQWYERPPDPHIDDSVPVTDKQYLCVLIGNVHANDIDSPIINENKMIKNGIYFDGVNVTTLVVVIICITLGILCICSFLTKFIASNKKQNSIKYQKIHLTDSDVSDTTDVNV